jgi:hypothetical protein
VTEFFIVGQHTSDKEDDKPSLLIFVHRTSKNGISTVHVQQEGNFHECLLNLWLLDVHQSCAKQELQETQK